MRIRSCAVRAVVIAAAGGAVPTAAHGQTGAARDAAVYGAFLDSVRAEFGRLPPVVQQLRDVGDADARGVRALVARVPGFDTAVVAAFARLRPGGRLPRRALARRLGRGAIAWIDSTRVTGAGSDSAGVGPAVTTASAATDALWLSRVAYGPGGRWALLDAEYACPHMCSRAWLVVLERRHAGTWRVRALARYWST